MEIRDPAFISEDQDVALFLKASRLRERKQGYYSKKKYTEIAYINTNGRTQTAKAESAIEDDRFCTFIALIAFGPGEEL